MKKILQRIEKKLDLLLSSFSLKTKENKTLTLLEVFNKETKVISLKRSRKMLDYREKLRDIKKKSFMGLISNNAGVVIEDNREFSLLDDSSW